MIQITNQVYNNYIINKNIYFSNKTGIFFTNNSLLKGFLLKLAGINKANKIYYRSRKAFDNEDYFNTRLYLDCDKQILNSLNSKTIAKNLIDNYNLVINEDRFNTLVNLLDVRMDGNLIDYYKFNKEGVALTNILIALSSYKNLIFNNLLENITDSKKIDLIKKEFLDKGFITGVTDLKKYTSFLDEIIFFSNEKVFYFTKDTILLVVDNVVSQTLLIEASEIDNLIVYKSTKTERLIILDNLNHDQMKVFNEYRVKITKVNIFNIGEYLC